MPPLFACHRCGMQIERSMESYWRTKGRLICSGCLDQQEEEANARGPAGAARPQSDPDRRDQRT